MLLLAALIGCAKTQEAAVDLKSAVQAQASPTLSTDDTTFLNEAGRAGITEVTFGQLARAQGHSAAVRDYGLRMTVDHTTSNQQLTRIAEAKGITLTNTVDLEHQAVYDRIAGLRGRAFDHAYLDNEVADHTAALALYQTEAARGTDPQVRAFAARGVPGIEAHLTLARRLGGHAPPPWP
jgi:putative membrane protein